MTDQKQNSDEQDAKRYRWLREYATGYQLDILANLDEEQWDDYIDGAINRK